MPIRMARSIRILVTASGCESGAMGLGSTGSGVAWQRDRDSRTACEECIIIGKGYLCTCRGIIIILITMRC
jgi:hypothetical protein